MRIRLAAAAALLLVGILVADFVGVAIGSRNSSGTYSLPSGNPVVPGTSISSTWANTTLGDLATEVTNSVDRNGRGAMLAPLALPNGTSTAPALTFSAELTSGLWRAGPNDVRVLINSTPVEKWSGTGVAFPLGLTVTQSTTNANACTAAANGTGTGGAFTGGGTGGTGVSAIGGTGSGPGGIFTGGAGNANGSVSTGTGTAVGVVGTGGAASGAGGFFTGGAPNGVGVHADGVGSGAAIAIGSGNAVFTGANPASSTGFANTLTPKNFVKAWAFFTMTVGGVVTIADGFNISGCALVGSPGFSRTIKCSFQTPMGNNVYAVLATGGSNSFGLASISESTSGRTAGYFFLEFTTLGAYLSSNVWSGNGWAGPGDGSFMVLGTQ